MHASLRVPCGNTMQHARAASGEPQPDASADDEERRCDDRLRECAFDSHSYASLSQLCGGLLLFLLPLGGSRDILTNIRAKVAYLNIKWTKRNQSIHLVFIIVSLLPPFLVSTTFWGRRGNSGSSRIQPFKKESQNLLFLSKTSHKIGKQKTLTFMRMEKVSF